ncbi:hypothetical protein D3C86_1949870 [compost metagenome]
MRRRFAKRSTPPHPTIWQAWVPIAEETEGAFEKEDQINGSETHVGLDHRVDAGEHDGGLRSADPLADRP